MPSTRTYEFVLRFEVDDDHVGFEDPEWIADAAWGAITNLYGLRCTYGQSTLIAEQSHSERE